MVLYILRLHHKFEVQTLCLAKIRFDVTYFTLISMKSFSLLAPFPSSVLLNYIDSQ